MDLSTRYAFLFVFIGLFLLGEVLSCDPLGERTKCGDGSSSSCPSTCCVDTSTTPNCYFNKKDYRPIRHSNGLCLNVKYGSHSDNTSLIWSRDCTSRNAFFLVLDYLPAYHVASGKCVLPQGKLDDPGKSADLFLKSGKYCELGTVTYRPKVTATEKKKVGNLEYFYDGYPYHLCIGSKSVKDGKWEPRENDKVSVETKVCEVNNSCKLDYVYERKFSKGTHAEFQCESCSLGIEVIWADYGVMLQQKYPFQIANNDPSCRSTNPTSVVQNKCNNGKSCSFTVRDADFLSSGSNCSSNSILLVRYKCKKNIPATPRLFNVEVISQNNLTVAWSNDDNTGTEIKFLLCWMKHGEANRCRDESFSENKISRSISGLQAAAKYIISVARYSKDGKTLGEIRQKAVITRTAALQAGGINPTNSFQIKLGKLQSEDIYVQIVVSKLPRKGKPSRYPGEDLQPYDGRNLTYIAAELDKAFLNENMYSLFTVGDGEKYTRRNIEFENVKLIPGTHYSVLQRTFKTAELYYDSDWMDAIQTDQLPQTHTFSPKLTTASRGGWKRDGCDSHGANTGDEKYLVGIIVMAVLLVISMAITGYFICQNRRLKSLKKNPEKISKEGNNSIDEHVIPAKDEGNFEEVGNEQSTYAALKKPGERDDDDHVYTHLVDAQKIYVNQEESRF